MRLHHHIAVAEGKRVAVVEFLQREPEVSLRGPDLGDRRGWRFHRHRHSGGNQVEDVLRGPRG